MMHEICLLSTQKNIRVKAFKDVNKVYEIEKKNRTRKNKYNILSLGLEQKQKY